MGASQVYKRRRAHVQRENPKFFNTKENGIPRRRESIMAEYERLTAVSAYDRDPKAGTERPEGGVIPTTPPLKPVQPQDQVAKETDGIPNDHAYPEVKATTKSLRRDFQDLVLDAKEITTSKSAQYLSSHEITPNIPDFGIDEVTTDLVEDRHGFNGEGGHGDNHANTIPDADGIDW